MSVNMFYCYKTKSINKPKIRQSLSILAQTSIPIIYLDIQRHPHIHCGYSVEVKCDSEYNYYCEEKGKEKEGCC